MPVDLSKFGVSEMLRCSMDIRQVGAGAPTMEAAARCLSRYFYDALETREGERACVLVRVYKTHAFGGLPDGLQRYAKRALGAASPGDTPIEASADMRCLTLLASSGDEASWNDRNLSRGHRAIPLPSPQIVQRAPMIAQLINEFGLAITDVLKPSDDVIRELDGKTYGVFHVEDATGSPYIPAQAQFVKPHGVRSVIGFGGMLASGDLFAVILFTKLHVPPRVADRFRALALDVKSTLVPFGRESVFEDPSAPPEDVSRRSPRA